MKSEIDQRVRRFKEACRNAGVKCTPQRIEIFSQVIQNSNHPDAETVYQSVLKRMPKVSLDTVYRTLWLLKDLDLINTLGLTRDRTRFDANLNQHHHFVCDQCGATLDFYSKKLNEIKISEHVEHLGKAITSQINIHGVCLECTNSKKTKFHQQNKGEKT